MTRSCGTEGPFDALLGEAKVRRVGRPNPGECLHRLPRANWVAEIDAFDSGSLAAEGTPWGHPRVCISADGVTWDRPPEQLIQSWPSVAIVGETVLVIEDLAGDSIPGSIRVGRLIGRFRRSAGRRGPPTETFQIPLGIADASLS